MDLVSKLARLLPVAVCGNKAGWRGAFDFASTGAAQPFRGEDSALESDQAGVTVAWQLFCGIAFRG